MEFNPIKLRTKVTKELSEPNITIPAGSNGKLLDVIIENGKVSFLLDFTELGVFEWYETSELEEKF